MARLRTFIAVDLGRTLRERCVALQETLSRAEDDVKWVEEKNLHATLLFLGEVNDRDLPVLCDAVAEVSKTHGTFTLSLDGVGCFPNPRRPRTVWVGVGQGAAELTALHDALEVPLLELGCYRREERQFTPHITLGRRKSERDAEALARAIERQSQWHGGEVPVREVLVLSSELTRDGPIYTALSRAKLTETRH